MCDKHPQAKSNWLFWKVCVFHNYLVSEVLPCCFYLITFPKWAGVALYSICLRGLHLNAMFSRKLCYVYCPQELSVASLWGEHLQQEARHFSGLGNWKEVFCMMSASFHSKLPLNTGLCAPASFSPGSLSFLFFWWARVCEWTACSCEQALQRLSKPFGLLVVAGLTRSVVLTPM